MNIDTDRDNDTDISKKLQKSSQIMTSNIT